MSKSSHKRLARKAYQDLIALGIQTTRKPSKRTIWSRFAEHVLQNDLTESRLETSVIERLHGQKR
ncbi:MAG: hypothetical protein K2X93_26300 [Candidatus Obscuribacterales bacterium]|nr:hypothetical protein [Candidatus Obscuribacterales bacterium]